MSLSWESTMHSQQGSCLVLEISKNSVHREASERGLILGRKQVLSVLQVS